MIGLGQTTGPVTGGQGSDAAWQGGRHFLPGCLTNRRFYGTICVVVLDGELAVPCTRKPP
jgi:hypothetical protein